MYEGFLLLHVIRAEAGLRLNSISIGLEVDLVNCTSILRYQVTRVARHQIQQANTIRKRL